VLRRFGGAFFGRVFPGSVGGSLALRFSLLPNAACAFREGDGTRAVGFSFAGMIGILLPGNEGTGSIGLLWMPVQLGGTKRLD
jgi:hypothetical protein